MITIFRAITFTAAYLNRNKVYMKKDILDEMQEAGNDTETKTKKRERFHEELIK